MSSLSVFNAVRLAIVFAVSFVCVLKIIGYPFNDIQIQKPVISDPFGNNKLSEIQNKIQSIENKTLFDIKNLNEQLKKLQSDLQEIKNQVPKDNSDDLQQKITNLESTLESISSQVEKIEETNNNLSGWIENKASSQLNEKSEESFKKLSSQIDQKIQQKLSLVYADRIGKVDFALKTTGARIVESMTSDTYDPSKTEDISPIKLLGDFILGTSAILNPPTLILDPYIVRGRCWPMKGNKGFVTIQLPHPIVPTEFTIEHLSKKVATDPKSAPQDIQVYGVKENDEHVFLATYKYDLALEPPYQTFSVEPQAASKKTTFSRFKLKVESNYGNPNYTCIYRFSIHGNKNAE